MVIEMSLKGTPGVQFLMAAFSVNAAETPSVHLIVVLFVSVPIVLQALYIKIDFQICKCKLFEFILLCFWWIYGCLHCRVCMCILEWIAAFLYVGYVILC